MQTHAKQSVSKILALVHFIDLFCYYTHNGQTHLWDSASRFPFQNKSNKSGPN